MLLVLDDPQVRENELRPVLDLPLVEEGKPPRELRLFQTGVNETTKGALLWDAEAAEATLAAYRATKRERLKADYEHDSLRPANERSQYGAPASGHYALEVREDGLYAVDIKWTQRAYDMIAAGEYVHFSPAVIYDPETRRIKQLVNFALTNNPATIGQPQLVAASETAPSVAVAAETAPTKELKMKMPEALRAKLQALMDGEYENEEMLAEALRKLMMELMPTEMPEELRVGIAALMQGGYGEERKAELRKMLADFLGEPRKEEQAQLAALSTGVATLTGKNTVAEQLAVLTALKHSERRVETLTSQVMSLATEGRLAKFDRLLEAKKVAGKLTTADVAGQTEIGRYLMTLRNEIAVAAKKEPHVAEQEQAATMKAAEAFCAALPTQVAVDEQPEPRAAVLQLSAEQEKIAKLFGMDPKEVARLNGESV